MEQYEEARKSYSYAIQFNRDYSLAYVNRGQVQQKLGQYEGALEDFKQALELASRDSLAGDQNLQFRLQVNVGDLLLFFRRYEEAIAAYDEALKLEPESQDVVAFKGNPIAALGRLEEALTLIQQGYGFISFDKDSGVSIKHG
jgi:tetratricopeptide (TPR) repeat protein